MPIRPIEWIPGNRNRKGLTPGYVRLLDQTLLPGKLVHLKIRTVAQMCEAIEVLRVRGAPAIGVAAAMGVVLAAQESRAKTGAALLADVRKAVKALAATRPTAVNLFKGLAHMKPAIQAAWKSDRREYVQSLVVAAVEFFEQDRAMCRAIGEHGASLLKDGQTILTHCNAGSLATSEYGTALAAIYVAAEQGRKVKVFADETRPLLQGARLTAWELMEEGIDVTLICDNMAAQVMKEGRVSAVLVGADRIAANGDSANKIGTYGVAVLARAHGIPFYVLAPTSTFDLSLSSGKLIPIEQRGSEEVTCGFGKRTAPEGVKVYSPAFDVTPAELITAIICEAGIARPDFKKSLRKMISGK